MSFLSSLFGSQQADIADPIRVDMHSHILPGIDDGAKDTEAALGLVQALMKLGYTHAIATPHVMADGFRNDTTTIKAALEKLRGRLAEENIDFHVDAAAEYYLDENFDALLKRDDILTIGKKGVLIETSFLNENRNLMQIIFNMQSAGYTPILAHPERYVYMYGNDDILKELREKNVKFQVNLASLVGYYSPESKRVAEYLLKNGMIDYIGTDVHHMRHIQAYEKAVKTKAYRQILANNPVNNSLLEGHAWPTAQSAV